MANPKNANLLAELASWHDAQRKKRAEEEEKRRTDAINAILGANPYPYGYGTYGGIARSYAQPGQQEDALPKPLDPSAVLREKIAKLQSIEPAKVSASRVPDYSHTLTGWRGWAINSKGQLSALGSHAAWKPKKAVAARCTNEKGHPAPAKSCQCGYWSFNSLDTLTEAMRDYARVVAVIGQVEIWGRVIECTNGWRSEYAYPKELWLINPDLEHLSWTYGVPVRAMGGK